MGEEFKVVIITPTTGICRMTYAQSLARLVMYFSQVQVFEGIEHQWLTVDSVEGSGIAANYHNMVKKYLADTENHWTHFLSIEDDMGFEPDTLHTLARRRIPFIGCNYKTNKGWPIRWTSVSADRRTSIVTDHGKQGVEEAYVIPQGFTLVAREVFEQTPKPWFMQGYSHESDSYTFAQDYYFCIRAAEVGFKCYVDHDASKKIWHAGVKNYRWNVPDESPNAKKVEMDNDFLKNPNLLINHLMRSFGYKSYLEIGTAQGYTYTTVEAERKCGVDPKPTYQDESILRMTSDEFFAYNRDRYDCIFVDGLHIDEQVQRDVRHSLDCLNPGGIVLVHDINPYDSCVAQDTHQKDSPFGLAWMGTAWRAWIKLRQNLSPEYEMFVVDVENGMGIIKKNGRGERLEAIEDIYLTYDNLDANREQWLNLVSIDYLLKWVLKEVSYGNFTGSLQSKSNKFWVEESGDCGYLG